MTTETRVFGTEMRRSSSWRVYRIRTENSTYELEVEGPTSGRRCVVLTRVEPAGERFEDSSPQVDGQSLFALSPVEWMGRCLTVGTARTSALQSVDFITTAEARSPRTVFAPAAPKPHAWSPFPAGQVEMAETAAVLLKLVSDHQTLADAVRGDPVLRERLQIALASCRLMLGLLTA